MKEQLARKMEIPVMFQAAVVCFILALASVPACGQSKDPHSLRIAYASNADGNLEIYTMNPDGSGRTRLTKDAAKDAEPKWSPDGKRIAFKSTRDGNDEIYVMNEDGSNRINVTRNPATDEDCSWSPDSKELVFASNRDGNFEMYVMLAGGTNVRRLTSNQSKDLSPSVSPDGRSIVFVSSRDERDGIHVMNYDGSGVRRLPTTGGNPRWSADGKSIVFHHSTDGNMDIWRINADGSDLRRLTDHPAHDGLPSESPDGSSIAFVSTRGNKPGVYLMTKDGMNVGRITPEGEFAMAPCWAPLPAAATADSQPISVVNGVNFQLELTRVANVTTGPIEIKGRRLQTTFVTVPITLRNLTSQKQRVNVSDAFTLHHPEQQADAFRLLKEEPGLFILEFGASEAKDCEIQYIMNPEAPPLRGRCVDLEWETFLGTIKIPLTFGEGQ